MKVYTYFPWLLKSPEFRYLLLLGIISIPSPIRIPFGVPKNSTNSYLLVKSYDPPSSLRFTRASLLREVSGFRVRS